MLSSFRRAWRISAAFRNVGSPWNRDRLSVNPPFGRLDSLSSCLAFARSYRYGLSAGDRCAGSLSGRGPLSGASLPLKIACFAPS